MTIRTVENLSGMTRANIRFYEVEGLISPQRGENGYRDYSEQDLEILKRIRLLRALRIPLEEIKALQSGQKELLAALDEQIEVLAREQKLIGRSQEVCREMRADGVQYEALNAQRYLDVLMQEKESADTLALTEDVAPLFCTLVRPGDLQYMPFYRSHGCLSRQPCAGRQCAAPGDLGCGAYAHDVL